MDASLSQFHVVADALSVGGRTLTVSRPRSAEELIDEAEYARDERLPYWAELWPSGLVLAEWLDARPLTGRTVLELGCGVGVPSIVAALGGADVVATDWYAPALAFTRANATANGARLATVLADWADPPPSLTDRPPFDLVIGADVLYEDRNGVALAALLPRLLAPGATCVIADPRRPQAETLIEALLGARWTHREEDLRYAGVPDEQGPVIRLHHLTAPPG
ncbi:MAG: methyltransferase [Thermoleophilia bacterium]